MAPFIVLDLLLMVLLLYEHPLLTEITVIVTNRHHLLVSSDMPGLDASIEAGYQCKKL